MVELLFFLYFQAKGFKHTIYYNEIALFFLLRARHSKFEIADSVYAVF